MTRALLSIQAIEEFAQAVAQAFKPSRIILFGSYAWGEPDAGSDVDLLVIIPHADPAPVAASRIAMAIPHDFALDLIVRSAEEVRDRLANEDWFLREIMERGQVLYEARDA